MLQSKAALGSIAVEDLTKAKQFYTQVLGLVLADESMGLRLQLPGGGSLFIYDKPKHQPADFTVLNFVVDDIDAAVEELTGQGVVFERYDNMPGQQDEKGIARGRAAGTGPDIAWFKDPAGNILSVLQDA